MIQESFLVGKSGIPVTRLSWAMRNCCMIRKSYDPLNNDYDLGAWNSTTKICGISMITSKLIICQTIKGLKPSNCDLTCFMLIPINVVHTFVLSMFVEDS